MLSKYAAASVASIAIAYVGFLTIRSAIAHGRQADGPAAGRFAGIARILSLALPLLILPIFAVISRTSLIQTWQVSVGGRQATGTYAEILAGFAALLWLPLVFSVVAVSHPRNRVPALGLLLTGMGIVGYHLLNHDGAQLQKHSCYVIVTLAPLAASGIITTARTWVQGQATDRRVRILSGALGLAVMGYLGLMASHNLPIQRSVWSDSVELTRYMQGIVKQDDLVLMEAGHVGNFYLVEKATPGRVPQPIVDTWWYQDEQGYGKEAYGRAIDARRFDYIIFDYQFTKPLDDELLEMMRDRYELKASFPAHRYGDGGRIDVFAPDASDSGSQAP